MTQIDKVEAWYAPLVGINELGEKAAADELQFKNGFWNYGLWENGATDTTTASRQLFEHLIGLLPPPPARILDVAFGQGASLHRLCAIYGEENVVGINIANDQVAFARQTGLSCQLEVMDAARLSFDDQSFDGILCIEAAFHFRTRLDFLRHAFRILRPHGRLSMSDILMRSGVGLDGDIFPPENIVQSIDDYKKLFVEAGFGSDLLDVNSSTNVQLVPFFSRIAESTGYLPTPDPEKINMELPHSQAAIQFILTRLLNAGNTVLVSVRRH